MSTYSASGGVFFSGSGPSCLHLFYTGSGGIATGESATINFDLPAFKSFVWNDGSGTLRWFRVTGKCKPPAPAPPEPSTLTIACDRPCPQGSPNESCNTAFTANIAARNVNELCQKIKQLRLPGPIDKIEVFSVPVFGPSPDIECNTLTEIPHDIDDPEAPDCTELFVDFNVLVCAGIKVSIPPSPSGGMRLFGSASVSSSAFSYTGGGGLSLFGGSTISLGLLLVTGKVKIEVLDFDVTFAFVPAPQDSPSTDAVDTLCCPSGPTAIQVQVKHNLSNVPALAQFLQTNRLSLPLLYPLTFAKRLGLWYNTLHFKGISSFNQPEIWEIVTEFGCESDVNQEPDNNWKFILTILRCNDITREQGFVRFQTLFDPFRVCKPDGNVKFIFEFNVLDQQTAPPHTNGLIFTDNMGAFRGSVFLRDPILRFEVSVSVPNFDAGVLDYTNYVVIPREP